MIEIKAKIEKLLKSSSSLGKVGLLIIENENTRQTKQEEAIKSLSSFGYKQCTNYIELMASLNSGKNKILYFEEGERLDGSVLEIVAEYEAGIVSLADRKNSSGLITAKWNPANVSLVLIMTRQQIENSYQRLFEYISIIQSL